MDEACAAADDQAGAERRRVEEMLSIGFAHGVRVADKQTA